MSDDQPCPCGGSDKNKHDTMNYGSCCGRWHAAFAAGQGLQAPDAEALMRSRYSAYVLDLLDYLRASWHAGTRPAALAANEPGLRWMGLEVKKHLRQDDTHATVEFVARSKPIGGRAQRLHEISRFERVNGEWLYLDGELEEA